MFYGSESTWQWGSQRRTPYLAESKWTWAERPGAGHDHLVHRPVGLAEPRPRPRLGLHHLLARHEALSPPVGRRRPTRTTTTTPRTTTSPARSPRTGKLALLYTPVARTITINTAQLVPGYTAQWVDPYTGARITAATPASSYTTPGTNSHGDDNWYLLLEESSGSDNQPPDTSITGGPTEGRTYQRQPPRRSPSRAEAGSTFQCRVDAAAFAACTTPFTSAALSRRRAHLRGPRDRPRRQHRPDARQRGRSPSTPRRRTRRSPAARAARPTTRRRRSPSPRRSRRRPSSAARRRRLRALHLAADHRRASPTAPHVPGARDRRRRQHRPDPGDADVHGRHRRAGHDDHGRPDRRRPTTATPTFAFTRPRPARRSSAASTARPFAACTSPFTPPALADGAHTFAVRATDAAGNIDPTPATRTFTVDTDRARHHDHAARAARPTTRRRRSRSPPTEAGSTFECRSTPAPFAACTSPLHHAALADGAHTFSVRAIDAAGNADPTPATRSFTVDTTAPDTTITGGPDGADQRHHADVHVHLDRGRRDVRVPRRQPAPFADLHLAVHDRRARRRRPHVRGPRHRRRRQHRRDARHAHVHGRHHRAATRRSHRPDRADQRHRRRRSRSPRPRRARRSSAASTARGVRACTSPQSRRRRWPTGAHTFDGRAPTDAAGNIDATPATRTFTVDTAAPDTTITSGPTGATTTHADVHVHLDRGRATFECRLDAAAFAACTSPLTTPALADGAHTFSVRAIDAPATSTPRRPRAARSRSTPRQRRRATARRRPSSAPPVTTPWWAPAAPT